MSYLFTTDVFYEDNLLKPISNHDNGDLIAVNKIIIPNLSFIAFQIKHGSHVS